MLDAAAYLRSRRMPLQEAMRERVMRVPLIHFDIAASRF